MLQTVGTPILRVDAKNKLKGKALYAADISFPDMLRLKVLRSSVPRARIEGIDASKALALPGVKGVFTAQDIPGTNRAGPRVKDEYLLCENEVNVIGDPIALVAATSEEVALEAIRHIQVHLEELPPVFTIEEAMDPKAPAIHEGGNIVKVRTIRHGDADQALNTADIVIFNTYRTQTIEHAYLEPEAAVASYHDGKLTVWAPSKYINADHIELSAILNLDPQDLRLILSTVGGYFGGKSGVCPSYYCALATYLTGQPSKMVYTREESFICSTKRHPYIIEHTLGARQDGRLVAARIKILADVGAYSGFSPSVVSRSAVHASGPYDIPNVLVNAYCIHTNNSNAGAIRGFGVPQMAIAYETQMDLLAERVEMDPIEIRRLNYMKKGSYTITGQRLENSVGLEKTCHEVRQYLEKTGQRWRYSDGQYHYGLGVASMFYGIGSTGIPNPAEVRFSCEKDSTIHLFAGVCDGGQGAATILSQIGAESIGVPIERLRFAGTDTDVTPDSGTSTASRLTYVVGRAVFEGGKELRNRFIHYAAHLLQCKEQAVRFENSEFFTDTREIIITLDELFENAVKEGVSFQSTGYFDPDTTHLDPDSGQGVPYGTYAFATQVALAKVDRDTGQIEMVKVIAAHDVGQSINPNTVEAQIQGGVVMGVGYGTMENVVTHQGKILNPDFQEYLIPTAMDIPEIQTIIVEDPEPSGPYGAKGVGEPALIPTAPAILNAVARATGCQFFEIPLTAETVWTAMKEGERK
ncbi:MAG: xanthine dehydrogenase family protein molybdopterin-binding subunit [Deltaproteobacteria bacterium]|nr:xanthine dehydrogenase family protein molybdopterin-binding subunit [Deltaproteobacteria bacterium]MBW2341364.1 xanthine dehydrogenase family protein molybdopterin-binding subunit [Deltaproteobacteria bacterium]